MTHTETSAAVHVNVARWRWVAIVWMVFALCACGKADHASPQPPPPEVSVMKVSATPVTVFDNYPAQAEAVQSVEIRARVGGFLQRQAFQDGALVKDGDLLFQLEQDQYASVLEQVKANLLQAQASWLNSRQNLARLRPLLVAQAVSQLEVDAAIAQERADAASVEAGKAEVRQAQLNLGYTVIRAPREGMVSRALIKPGGLVNPSTTLLTVLYSVDPIYVSFTISEQKLAQLQQQYNLRDAQDAKPKAPEIRLKLIDGSDYRYPGKLNFVDPAIDPRNGTLPVRLVVPNPEGALRHGQFVRAIVPARTNPEAILVPQKAVQELQGKYSVYVVGPDNKAVHRDIVTGSRVGNDWVVEQGLKPGELVIVEGIAKVKPDMPVKTVPAEGQGQGQGQGGPGSSPAQSTQAPPPAKGG